MAETKSIEIHPSGVMIFNQFIDEARVSPQAYIDQSLRLGLYMASWAVRSQAQPSIMFQRSDGIFSTIPFEFVPISMPTSPAEIAHLDPDNDRAPLLVPVEAGLHVVTAQVADRVCKVSQESFLNTGVLMRWHWARTRNIDARILLDPDSSDSGYVPLDDDEPLYYDKWRIKETD